MFRKSAPVPRTGSQSSLLFLRDLNMRRAMLLNDEDKTSAPRPVAPRGSGVFAKSLFFRYATNACKGISNSRKATSTTRLQHHNSSISYIFSTRSDDGRHLIYINALPE